MQRHLRLAAAGLLVLFAAACGEVPTSAPSAAQLQRVDATASIVPGTCTNLAQLNTLAATIFTPTSSPSINSVRGKLKNLDKLVKKGDLTGAKSQATEIVAFVLKKHNQGGLAGTDAQVEAFTNQILCFAGFDLEVEQPDNTFLILPSDLPQVVVNIEGNAGISFPGNPVSEPTLVEVLTIPNAYGPGDGPLDTKLDQYPGFVQVNKTSENGVPLAKPAVVGVCATGVIPADVRARLRLGHGAANGFEVTPAASANFLSCPPPQIADAGATPLWKRIANAILPSQLHAFQQEFGGGVGGTVTEFSPFAPVDPQLEFGGGVGGTVTEFIRVPAPGVPMPTKKGAPMNQPSIVVDPCATGTAGTPLPTSCVPSVRITTRLGTVLANVPVLWNVTAGGGSIAPKSTVCGSYGPSASTLTNALGRAGICWTLGAPGSNKVSATPSAGGDAPAGVLFVPAQSEFEVLATPGVPTAISIVQGGELQWNVPAGTPVPIAPIVRVTDANGYPVPGVLLTWASFPNEGVLSTFNPHQSTTGADGTATTIWTIGDRYAHMLAFFYVLPDGTTSSTWAEGAVKLYASFEATTER